MGKIKARVLGDPELEKQQKEESKKKAAEKKAAKKSTKALIEAEKKEKVEAAFEEKGEIDTASAVEPHSADAARGKEEKQEAKRPAKVKSRGKKYQEARKSLEKGKVYSLEDAVALLKKIKFAKFDESVELHMNLDETGLRGEVELPHSTGKTVRVKIVDDALLAELEKGVINFDVLVAHPSFMGKLAKYAKVLGPKGLMPNPKAGTISPNPEQVVKKFEKGILRWKSEAKFPLIHQMVGKVTHDDKALVENSAAFIKSVGKPHIKALYIKTTMSPALKLDLEKI